MNNNYRFTSRSFMLTLLFGGLLSIGCGGQNSGSVSGVVTIDGKPADGLQVEFIPVDLNNPPALAYTSQGGNYQLIQGRGNRQIPVGDYRVAISVFPETAPPEIRALKLPPKYASATDTELKATIQSGTNEINFDLTTH